MLEEFVELDRRFLEADPDTDPEQAALIAYTRAFAGLPSSLGWNELLQHPLVVILGEPGSGKSWELRHQASSITARGDAAFYVDLARLVQEPLAEVLTPAERARLEDSRLQMASATFLLDSVDEAKLRRSRDFVTALDRLQAGLTGAPIHSRVIISSRITEWNPAIDAAQLARRFPRIDPAPERTEAARGADKGAHPLVVNMLPLDAARVRLLAAAHEVDPVAFEEALETSHALEFARRPQDAIGLIEYWKRSGRLGSLTELIEFDIARGLRESPERERQDRLTPEEARRGAEALAAAVVLCQRFDFRVPEAPPDVAPSSLDAHASLPGDWTPDKQRALQSRAVFDAATYGAFRFHHRRTAEYLAAAWVAARIRSGCPIGRVEKLLFAEQSGRRLLRPALAPVTAWLACGPASESWREDLREALLDAKPETLLQYGDPAALSINYRERVLVSLINRYSGRVFVRLDEDAEALGRLADPALAPLIASKIRDKTLGDGLRYVLIRLVWHGRLGDALSAALDVFEDPEEAPRLKEFAVVAVRDAGDRAARKRLNAAASSLSRMPSVLCAHLCEALFPTVIDADGLVTLLGKAEPPPEHSVDLPYYLTKHLEAVLDPTLARALIAPLCNAAFSHPRSERRGKPGPVSEQYRWLGRPLAAVLKIAGSGKPLTEDDAKLVGLGLWVLARLTEDDYGTRTVAEELGGTILKDSRVRRSYCWRSFRASNSWDAGEEFRLLWGVRSRELLRAGPEDLPWLVADAAGADTSAERDLAFRLALEIWQYWDSSLLAYWDLRAACRNAPERLRLLKHAAFGRLLRPARRIWSRWVREKLLSARWWSRVGYRLNESIGWIRAQWVLHKGLRRLHNGTATRWLAELCWEANDARSDSHTWAVHSWHALRRRRGPLVAWAARQGCKRAWRTFTPRLPHESFPNDRVDPRVIVGLSGIAAAVADGEIELSGLAEAKARQLCRYALREINGFPPWFNKLAQRRAEVIDAVLLESIAGEWEIGPEAPHVHEVMGKLRSYGSWLTSRLGPRVRDMLEAADPRNDSVLADALAFVSDASAEPRLSLGRLAARRTHEYASESSRYLLWLVLWFQHDGARALEYLTERLPGMSDPDNFMVKLTSSLEPTRSSDRTLLKTPSYLDPDVLRHLIPLVFRHIRPADDIPRGRDAHRVTDRDMAREFRAGLVAQLAESPLPQADDTLVSLLDEPLMLSERDWIMYLLERRTERDSDLPPWKPEDVRSFEEVFERIPQSSHDLFDLLELHLETVKYSVERAVTSSRRDLHGEDIKETDLRVWLARQLRDRGTGRYTVPEEVEIDQEQRPDILITLTNGVSIPIEIKWADTWSGAEVLERLENQLVGQYLRAWDTEYGIYVLGFRGKKQTWTLPPNGKRVGFDELVTVLRQRAKEVASAQSDIRDISVVGIDFGNPKARNRRKSGRKSGEASR